MACVHMTDEEAVERGFWAQKTWAKRIAALKSSTGFASTPWASRERHWYDPHACARFCEVSFNSSAWTGRI